MTIKDELRAHYLKKSKHSNYQVLTPQLKELINSNLEVNSRFEEERFKYLLSKINFDNKTILDIGGNTGYFTFRSIDEGALKAVHYEGNYDHSYFVQLAARALNLDSKVFTINEYFDFDASDQDVGHFDIVMLFNVLHHFGDDYGAKGVSIDDAKNIMIRHINKMAKMTDTLVLQIGFNLQGDIKKPLFKNGTKSEMIDFIRKGTQGVWQIDHIGIAEKKIEQCVYCDLNSDNISRIDSLGEFLNRPIFILSSKKQ